MITAIKPKPIPASNTLKNRPIAPLGAKSPKPSVKKVWPLKYKHVGSVGGTVSCPIGDASDHSKSAYETISSVTQNANSPNSENGPNTLKKCCFKPRRRMSPAM